MYHDLPLLERLSEKDPEFVNRVESTEKNTELYAMKLREVDPDRRELIQKRMDNLYRKSMQ